MKRGYPYSSGNLNFGYDYEHVPKSSKSGDTQGPEGPQGPQGQQGVQGRQGVSGGIGPVGNPGGRGVPGQKGPKGDKGEKGEQGDKGDQGVQGLGLKGDRGDLGLQGVQGPAGQQGKQGVQGTPGSVVGKGDTGSQGPKGDTGTQGPQGSKGPQGLTGPAGSDGAEGPAGPTGVGGKGDRGQKGDSGSRGDQGPLGPQGLKGDQGDRGSQGALGTRGPTGSKGDVGVRGAKGDKGDPGVVGSQGPTGQQGTLGTAVAKGDKGDTCSEGPKGDDGARGGDGLQGPSGPRGSKGTKGDQGDKGDRGDQGTFDNNEKRRLVTIDKNYENVSYEDDKGKSRGAYQKYKYNIDTTEKPYNGGYGSDMKSTRMSKDKIVPLFGSTHPLRIEQKPGADKTEVSLVKYHNDQDAYAVVFAVVFHGDTEDAYNGLAVATEEPAVLQSWIVRKIGSITADGDTYHYFLAKIGSQASIPDGGGVRNAFMFEFAFTSSELVSGKMEMDVFEGFIFKNLTDTNYTDANVTDSFFYPYLRGFEKQKLKDVTLGDVLLTGVEQEDGSVVPDQRVKIRGKNLELGAVFPMWNGFCIFGVVFKSFQRQFPEPPNHAHTCLPISILGEESVILLTNHSFKSKLPTTDNKIGYYLSLMNKSASATDAKLYEFAPSAVGKQMSTYNYVIDAKIRVGDVVTQTQIDNAAFFYFSVKRESQSGNGIGSGGSKMYYIILNPV